MGTKPTGNHDWHDHLPRPSAEGWEIFDSSFSARGSFRGRTREAFLRIGRVAKEFFAFDAMMDHMVKNQSMNKARIPEMVQAVYIMNSLLNMMASCEYKNEFIRINCARESILDIRTRKIDVKNIKEVYFENIYKNIFLESSGIVSIRESEEQNGHNNVIAVGTRALMLMEPHPVAKRETPSQGCETDLEDSHDNVSEKSGRGQSGKARLLKRALLCLIGALVFKFLILAFNAAWRDQQHSGYKPPLHLELRDSRRKSKEAQNALKALPAYEPAVLDIGRFGLSRRDAGADFRAIDR